MKHVLILIAILALPIGLSGQTSGRGIKGCLDPAPVAKTLAEIGQMRWRDLSVERAREIWPTKLSDYESRERLTSIRSEGRVISDHRVCGEYLAFTVDRKENGSATERLRSIDIWYSAPTRKELVTVARAFARATGLPDAKIATIGSDPKQDKDQEFSWDTASKRDFRSIDTHRELGEGRALELSALSSLWK